MSLKDPNLRFPSQPALAKDLDIFDMPDGLGIQIRGGATNLVVRGRLAKSLMPWLLEALKKTTSLETIRKTRPAGSTESEIDELLLLLLRKGYLVESGKQSDVPSYEWIALAQNNASLGKKTRLHSHQCKRGRSGDKITPGKNRPCYRRPARCNHIRLDAPLRYRLY